jgi:hypothetical protein
MRHHELAVSPTGRLIDHHSHLMATGHEQVGSLRPREPKSAEDRCLLASILHLQDLLLRKTLMPDLMKDQSTTPPDTDFSSVEQRIVDTCGIDPEYPYGR